MYLYIEPEVSGSLGDNTIMDSSVYPPIVSSLHYLFDSWLGDDLLESFPCYIVAESLTKEFELSKLSGYTVQNAEISTSEQFENLYSEMVLPPFYWLKITGKAGIDAFGIAEDFRLVVSKKALDVLKKGKIEEIDMEEF